MDIKINNLGGTISYSFSLTLKTDSKTTTYTDLSIECENYSGDIEVNWVKYNNDLEDFEDFEKIEQELFTYFEDKFKKQFNNKNFKL